MLTADQQQLFDDNIRLAYFFVHRHQRQLSSDLAISHDEFVSDALLGLMKACQTFDPNRGVRFATYAARVITNEIYMDIRRYKNQCGSAKLTPIEAFYQHNEDTGEVLDAFPIRDELTVTDTLYDGEVDHLGEILTDELNKLHGRAAEVVRLYLHTAVNEDIASRRKGQTAIGKQVGLSQSYVSRMISSFLTRVGKRYYGPEYQRPCHTTHGKSKAQ